MTEAKCDERIADLFTKGSHHRHISIVYLTQNLFPQGKACRDIALNTQYLVLFNDPIDRQQVATLARRIYPSSHAIFMKRFQNATSRPHGYLVVDLKSCTPEQDRLRENVFETESPATKKRKLTDEEAYFGEGNSTVTAMNDTDDDDNDDDDDDDDDDDVDDDNNDDDKDRVEGGVKRQSLLKGPPGKRIKEELKIITCTSRYMGQKISKAFKTVSYRTI
jgi:hypothetical protein